MPVLGVIVSVRPVSPLVDVTRSARGMIPSSVAAASAAAALILSVAGCPAHAQEYTPWFKGGPSYYYPRAKMKVRPPIRPLRTDDDTGIRVKRASGADATDGKSKDVKSSAGPLFGVISLSDQHISIYNGDGLVVRSSISSGMAGHRTPMGVFSIIQRNRWHRSNIYANAPMPFMQRLTWSGVALHLGVVPGYPASHGCVRLPSAFAQQLWGMTKIGERVMIASHDVAPVAFSHPLLPVPRMQPAPDADPDSMPGTDERAPAVGSVERGIKQIATTISTASDGPSIAAAAAAPKLLNPLEYAQALKVKTAADVTAAGRALKDAVATASVRAAEARRATADTRTAEIARNQAEAKVAAQAKAVDTAKTDEAREAAQAAKMAAETELRERENSLEEARQLQQGKQAAAIEAQSAWREASAAVGAAEQAAKDVSRRMSPISILVSRKNKRVYVRQGLRPVLEAEATIRDPDAPLGTHVYIATGTEAGAAALRWSAISMPTSQSASPAPRAGKGGADRDSRADTMAAPSTAAQALERIELPKEVNDQIAELLWLGASLIISDQPLSGETSDIGTDIVVTMR